MRMFVRVVVVAAWLFATVEVRATVVTDAFVEAVAQIESSGGRYLVGDGGKANGAWQMHEPAWQDTTEFRKRQGLPVWTYTHAGDPEVARLYARDYLTMLENQLSRALGENVTVELIYAAYNIGFSGFQRRGFLIEKAPSSTQAACARLAQLMEEAENSARQSLTVAKAQ